MRALLMLAVLVAAVATAFWLLQRYRASGELPGSRATPVLQGAKAVPGEYDEAVSMVFGPDPGPGRLRLTPTQLVFAAASGRVAVIERSAITGVTSTTELPDRHLAKPALVVTAVDDTWYVVVAMPETWVKELT